MPLHQEKKEYTIKDYESFPEDVRVELIDGQIFYQAAPVQIHQELLGYLYAAIFNYIRSNKGPCKVFPAPFAVRLNKDDKTTVEPDIIVVCDKDKLDGKRCNGAPDWIIEIISPSTSRHDYIRKLALYESAGVREYWIVDPENQMVTVYCFGTEYLFPKQYGFTDTIKACIYEDLFIDFSDIDIE
ncbi:Uma2 family endonuclease [Lachnospiraceae bacterium ZAX-1]